MENRIDLARSEPFRLGALDVRPSLRLLVRDDGVEEVLEPRVMQVLVALARADGAILSRDDLTRCCWEGRVVGEDAINRVVSRLRRSAEAIGMGSFRIETITKVGYRLIATATATPPTQHTEGAGVDPLRARLDRRAAIATGVTVAAIGGVFGWRHFAPATDAPPADVAPLLEQARLLGSQGNTDGNMQALSLVRRVTQMRPGYANGWGYLALLYAGSARRMAVEMEATMRARASEAANRAFGLDPENAYARFALATLDRTPGNWRRDEILARKVIAADARDPIAWTWLANTLSSVGRCREAADIYDRLHGFGSIDPAISFARIVALWAAGRLDAADKAATEAGELYPTQYAVWFTRLYLLLYTNRAADALAMVHDIQMRPSGYSDENFAMIEQIAQAMLTRRREDRSAAVAVSLDWAHRGAGFAENGIQFCSALGDLDAAFRIADAYYFGRGFDTGDNRFEPNRRLYTRHEARHTRLLFFPSTAAMRGDPRFGALVAELGLERYWRQTGTLPDYRTG